MLTKTTIRGGVGTVGVATLLVIIFFIGSDRFRSTDSHMPHVRDTAPDVQEAVSGSQASPRSHLQIRNEVRAESLDCTALAGSPESGRRMMLNRQRWLVRGFFETLEEQGYNTLQRQLVADLAGLDPFSVESTSYKSSVGEPAYVAYLLPPPRMADISVTKQIRLEEALKGPTLDEWFREVETDPSILRNRWTPTALSDSSANPGPTSVLGHALRQRSWDVQAYFGTLLVESFGLHELAVAIEVGMPKDRFLEALDRSDADPGETWRHHALRREINLAIVAVFNAKPDILQALIARGVEPSSPSHSVLDELAVSTTMGRASVAEIARQLVRENDQPFFPSTIEAFKRHFPTAPELRLHPDAVLNLATPGIEDAAKQLASMFGEWEDKIADAQRIEERCRESWLAGADVPIQTLVGKDRYAEASDRRLNEVMEGVSQEARSVLERADPVFMNAINLLREALRDQNWSEVLRLADQTLATFPDGVDHQSFYPTLLVTALRSGAPMDVVRVLIDRNGSSLPPYAILALADGDGSVAMAEQLEQLYGLDVHIVDDYGRNAVSVVVERLHDSERTLQWLDYLTSRSVATKPNPLGLDSLDRVLLAILKEPLALL